MIAQERLEHVAVGLEAVGPPVLAELPARLLDVRRLPREHRCERHGGAEVFVSPALRLHEGLVERQRDPAVRLVELAADHHGVHDRKDLRLAVIGFLDFHVVLEQAPDGSRPRGEGRGRPRCVHGVELAFGDHLRESLLRPDGPQPEFRWQVELELLVASRLLLAAGEVLRARRIDAVLVLQDAADPDRCGHLIFRNADFFARKILRLADAAFRRDENARVAEEARGEHRDRDEGGLLPHERNAVRGERHLRRVELAVAQHPEEGLLDEEVLVDEVDALGPHAAVGERARAIVVPAGEGKLELGHRIPAR